MWGDEEGGDDGEKNTPVVILAPQARGSRGFCLCLDQKTETSGSSALRAKDDDWGGYPRHPRPHKLTARSCQRRIIDQSGKPPRVFRAYLREATCKSPVNAGEAQTATHPNCHPRACHGGPGRERRRAAKELVIGIVPCRPKQFILRRSCQKPWIPGTSPGMTVALYSAPHIFHRRRRAFPVAALSPRAYSPAPCAIRPFRIGTSSASRG